MPTRGLRRAVAGLLAGSALLAGCGSDPESAGGSPGGLDGTVTVLAASSLTEVFEQIAAAFEAEHDGVEVELGFDGSSTLATQILEGAPADLFASADATNLTKVADAGLAAGEPVVIATNALQIVVPDGNPGAITGLVDLVAGGLRVALCAPEVPCGRYAAEAFAKAGLDVPAASQEENAKGVLTKVALGEADAGVVYVTDVLAATGVDGVDVDPAAQVPASYPATVLSDAGNPDVAAAFLAFLSDGAARAILEAAGFGAP
jgi:molybdate transport system substrate-binding protein